MNEDIPFLRLPGDIAGPLLDRDDLEPKDQVTLWADGTCTVRNFRYRSGESHIRARIIHHVDAATRIEATAATEGR